MNTDNGPSWNVPQKRLSMPEHFSPELKAALAESAFSAATPSIEDNIKLRESVAGSSEMLGGMMAQVNAALARQAQSGIETFGLDVAEDKTAGVSVYRVTPRQIDPAFSGMLFMHLHGGGYNVGGGRAALAESVCLSHYLGIQTLTVDYRMPGYGGAFPAAMEDVEAVYRAVLAERSGNKIIMGGSSAGGGLALAAVHLFKSNSLDLPLALYASSPWTDLTKSGDSYFTNEGVDRVLVTLDGMLGYSAGLYMGDHNPRDPLISPVYGDFDGFPPTQLVTGTRDLFLSCTVRVHRKMLDAGIDAQLIVHEGASHGENQMAPGTPETIASFRDLKSFLLRQI